MANDQTFRNLYQTVTVQEQIIAGEKNALKIFQKAAVDVPAYKDFLKKNKVNPQKIISFQDFQKVPMTDKKNYIDQYELNDLVWDGDISKNIFINSSSGTTGKPYYWPLDQMQIDQGAEIHRYIYNEIFEIKKQKTLLLVCFGMGTWIAGLYTTIASIDFANQNNLTIITPGFNKEETIKILIHIAKGFEKIIIAGIPTFIKDLIDSLQKTNKINYLRGKLKLLLSGEPISEPWRNYIAGMIHSHNPERDIIAILGSAEASIMGFETPETIGFRKLLLTDKSLCRDFFGTDRVPAVVRFLPEMRFFETFENEILITADRSIPLIRYNIRDRGGIISDKRFPYPLVYVFGRGRFTATLYAANIYPENISLILLDKKINKFVTGRFTLETKFKKNHDHYLVINIELSNGEKANKKLADKISLLFTEKVPLVNSEYARIKQEYGLKTKPKVILYQHGHGLFSSDNKVKKLS